MAEINDLNITDASNTARFPENMAPSAVNNGARALEGILARWHKDTNASKASTGSANAYVFAADQTISAYYDGLVIAFDANFANTGSATLNVDGVSADTIKKYNDQNLESGDIEVGQKVWVVHDGTNWQMISPTATVADTTLSNTFSQMQIWSKGADIASASPLVLGTDGNYFDVTGTTGFSSITVSAGTLFMLQFDGALTLTHGASLDLPGEANITTAAGDRLIAFAEAADTVQVLAYSKADGSAVSGSGTLETEQATTSGTAFDFTGISSNVLRITVIFEDVSLNGTDDLLVQIGDSGGIETTGYTATSGASSSTAGFILRSANAARVVSGHMIITQISGNTWIYSAVYRSDASTNSFGGGHKTLSGTLDRLRLTRTGSNTFDGGAVNILLE